MNNYRLSLERTIIAQCLLEGGYDQVANILSPKNFSKAGTQGLFIDHQKVFEAFTHLYPQTPIDLITTTSKFNDAERNIYSYALAGYLSTLSSCANIKFHAFLLLEFCIRTEFIDLLESHKNSLKISNSTIPSIAAINEIIDEAIEGDILSIIDASSNYLKNKDEELASRVIEFSRIIDRKVIKIKQLSHLECLVNNLMRIGNVSMDANGNLAISHLKNVIKIILSEGTVENDKLRGILNL